MKSTTLTRDKKNKREFSAEEIGAIISEGVLAATGLTVLVLEPKSIILVMFWLAIPLTAGAILASGVGKNTVAYRFFLFLHIIFTFFTIWLATTVVSIFFTGNYTISY